MKNAGGLLIYWATSLLILGLSVTSSEAGGKKENFDHCVNNTECESNKCCSHGYNGYCLESCDPEQQTTTRAATPPKQCSSAGKAYRHFKINVSWYHAMRLCCAEGNGARLADVITQKDDQFMGNISRANPGKATWIGVTALLSSQKKNLQWVYVGNRATKVFFGTQNDFDNYQKGEHCVHVRTFRSQTNIRKTEYNDYPCYGKNYYVCYYPNETC